MPDLLLELFSEEIPARFQRRAADDLKKAVTDAIVAAGLTYAGARAFVTPRRLALGVAGLPPRSPDLVEERKGPRVGAPPAAVAGFVEAAGLGSIEAASIVADAKKGDYYVARIERRGAATTALLAALLPEAIAAFPWPKSMQWGNGGTTWVRPLRAITATFGADNDETEVIDFAVGGVRAGRVTFGHRFLAPAPISVRRLDDYQTALERAKVVLDLDRRKDIIAADTETLAFAQGLRPIADGGLLEEVAGLVEWPVVMMGTFDPRFLTLPEEVIVSTIRANQKCFCLRDGAGRLANRFLLVANTIADDDGAAITAGNERVVRARLSDANFFYETDLKAPLEDGLPKLKDVVFHAKIGTQFERIERLVARAGAIAAAIGADIADANRAARLAKADLVTGMVGEFPELQGIMGQYYARTQGEKPTVAAAIAEHYRPAGPTDAVPTDRVAVAVALADKLDLLESFWAIEEKPTGSRDPFALRRAALGVIRILVENELSLPLTVAPDLLGFFHDRLRIMLRDQGARHDLLDAVITPASNDILEIVRRVAALSELLATDGGKNLLAGYRRAANILAAEERKDGQGFAASTARDGLTLAAEIDLAQAVVAAEAATLARLSAGDHGGAVEALATLRAPVDRFFEAVHVNDPDPVRRGARLGLLAALRATMHRVADFSRIEG